MKIRSFAKINLTLDILKKSGKHHHIRTVFRQISLHDELVFKKTANPKVTLRCNHPSVPLGPKNTVIKAVSLLKKFAAASASPKSAKTNITGLQVTLKKNIPIAAGLGGGSSNAAATLLAINKLWKLRFSPKILRQMAAKIGMDVPFFLEGGTALGTHYGEKIRKLPDFPLPPLLVAIPNRTSVGSSSPKTGIMYRRLKLDKTGKNTALTTSFITALKNKKISGMPGYFHNDFETLHGSNKGKNAPMQSALKKMLLRSGATVVHITGSGPAVYALYKNRKLQKKAYKKLKRHTRFLWKN